MSSAISLFFQIVILIFSVVIHEVSHGLMANALGDPTARYAGRLTLNPLKHLDWFGSFFLPLLSFLAGGFIFGWAKPVPYNPYNLKDQKRGPAYVAVAGPASNLLIVFIFSLAIRALPYWQVVAGPIIFFNLLAIFGLIVLLNLVLAIFNLIPIPPLDGSKLLFAVLPYRWYDAQIFLERYGLFLLLIFIFFFSRWLFPLVLFVFKILTGTLPF